MYELAESWYDARLICQKNGGDLVTFNTEDEYSFVWTKLKIYTLTNLLGNAYWHFGFYSDAFNIGHWVTGEPVTFTTWKDENSVNQPNICGGIDIAPDLGYYWVWIAYDCWIKTFFVCETPST